VTPAAKIIQDPPPKPVTPSRSPIYLLAISLSIGLITSAPLVLLRSAGFFQKSELSSFDQLIKMRPIGTPDKRIIFVSVDKEDEEYQAKKGWEKTTGFSLSETSIEQFLRTVKTLHPSVIVGFDIDHPNVFPTSTLDILKSYGNTFVAACSQSNPDQILNDRSLPSPNLSISNYAFSDFPKDDDKSVRRQLLVMAPSEKCKPSKAFSLQISHQYLEKYDIKPIKKRDDGNRELNGRLIPKFENTFGGYYLSSDDVKGLQVLLNYKYSNPTQIALREVLDVTDNAKKVFSNCDKNCIVLIGINKEGNDRHKTSYSDSTPGTVIHSHMISQILDFAWDGRKFVQTMPDWIETLWIFGWAVLAALLTTKKWDSLKNQTAATLTVFTLLSVSCFILLILDWWLPLVPCVIVFWGSAGLGVVYKVLPQAKIYVTTLENKSV
jgi:CHASE2 domain-containing sensor protein